MKNLGMFLSVIFITILLLALLFWGLGFRINTSDSIPRGLYQIVSTTEIKNKYVIFCPDNRPAFRMAKNRGYIGSGFCEGGSGLMMKKVVATSGDIISINEAGVTVNDGPLPFSTLKDKDANNRRLNAIHLNHYQLKEGELLTMTDQDEWSFDGRYYGLVTKSQFKGVLAPVWVIPLTNNTIRLLRT